jgi:hypothetical protein
MAGRGRACSDLADRAKASARACRINASVSARATLETDAGAGAGAGASVGSTEGPATAFALSGQSSVTQVWRLLAVALDLLETSRAGILRGSVPGGWEARYT